MAAFACVVTAFTATNAQAASSTITSSQSDDPATFNFLYSKDPRTPIVQDGIAKIEYSLNNANNSNWSLTLTAKNITPIMVESVGGDGEDMRVASILHRGQLEVTNVNDGQKWKLNTPSDNGIFVLVAPDGDIAVHRDNINDKKVTTTLDNIGNWEWDTVAELSVTLVYNNEEKRLSVASGYVQRTADGDIKYFSPIEDLKYDVPADFFTARFGSVDNPNLDSLFAYMGNGGSLTTVLVSESTSTGWRIEGLTSLNKLIDGDYYNVTGQSPVKISLQNGHKVQFLDNKGVIYLENGDHTYSNVTEAIADPASGSSSCSVGFGAAEGAILRIERSALASSVFNTTTPTDIRIVGDGTVILNQLNENDTLNLAELSGSGTLVLFNTTGAATINITTDKTSRSASINAARDLTINTGVDKDNKALGLQADEIAVSLGSLTINGNAASTVLANKIAASSQATLVGQYRANEITAGEKLQLGTTATNGAANVTASIVKAGTDIEVNGSLKADEVVAKQLITKKVTVATTSATAATLLSGNVSADSSGIKANTLTSANIIVDGDTIATKVSTGDRISITDTTLTAGALTAGTIDLQGSYNLGATEITADQVNVGTTNISGAETIISGAVTIENAAVYTNDAGKRLISASSIKADTVAIGENTLLIGADVTATNKMTIAQGSSVQNASINAGTTFDIGNNASLSNVVLNKGTLTNGSSVNVENLTVVTNAAPVNLGGTGNAVQIEGNIESVQLSGTLNDDNLIITKLVLNAEGLVFNEGVEKTYNFIMGNNLDYTYDAERDQINIGSYVNASMTFDDSNGIIRVVGTKDSAGIKQALADTHNRTEAIKAIDEALGNTPALATRTITAKSPLQEIHDYVGHVMRYSETDRKNVLSAASGASLAALADTQRRGLRDVQDNLRNRIIQMGGGTSAGLTTDWEYVGLQAWAQADGGLASTSGSGDEWGYDYDTMGATVGANIDLTANTVIGMSFSASYGEITVDDSTDHAKGNNDAQYISFFARHNKERWVQMFIFTYGMNEMDMERSVLGYNAKGDTKGETFSAYYELGYTLGIDYEYEHIVQPLVSVSFTSASVDSFEEAGSIGNAGINYANNSYFYGQVAIGARYQGVLYETIHERNAVVEARALITHDFGDTTDEASVALAGSKEYTVKGADSSGMGFKIGAGLSLPVEQHTTLYADVDYTSAPDYSGFRGNIGVRYDF